MNMETQKLEHFVNTVLSSAIAEKRQAEEELRQRRESAVAAAENDYLEESFAIVRDGVNEAREKAGKRVSEETRRLRRKVSDKRAELRGRVLARAEELLREYTLGERYPALLRGYAEQLAAAAGDETDITVALRPEDMKYADGLASAFGGRASFVEGDIRIGGMKVILGGRGLLIDKTLDAALEAAAEDTDGPEGGL